MEEWMEAEKERNLPEFKKQRPKYYYYFEWMKERISQHCGKLPAPVLDKLLNIEAGELDTLLNYPKGIQSKASLCSDKLTLTLQPESCCPLRLYMAVMVLSLYCRHVIAAQRTSDHQCCALRDGCPCRRVRSARRLRSMARPT